MAVEGAEVAEMQRFGEAPELQQIAAACGLREHFVRRHMPSVLVVRAQRRVIADRATVRHGKYRLKNAENRIAAVDDGMTGTRVARDGARRLKAGGIEIDHASGRT